MRAWIDISETADPMDVVRLGATPPQSMGEPVAYEEVRRIVREHNERAARAEQEVPLRAQAHLDTLDHCWRIACEESDRILREIAQTADRMLAILGRRGA